MDNQPQERVIARLFAGVLITSEIRMHLNQDSGWKNAQISAFHGSDDLIEMRHGKNEYIGWYLSKSNIPLAELRTYESLTVDKLLTYCPKLPRSSCKFFVFSQLLIH